MGSYIQQLVHASTELYLDRDPAIAGRLAWFRAGRGTESQAKAYLYWLAPKIEEAIKRPNVLPWPPDEATLYPRGKPDFPIGTLEHGLRFGIRLLDRPRNLVVVGTNGSGKTNALLALLAGIAARNATNPDDAVSCIVFQRKGVDFARLAQQWGWYRVGVHHGLRLSLAPPAGLPPAVYLNTICELFARRAGMIASANCLAQIMGFVSAVLNRDPGRTLLGPTFRLCLDVAEYAPPTLFSAKPEYMAFLRHTLTGVLHASESLVDAVSGLDLLAIVQAGKSICVDITNVRPAFLRLFIVDLLVTQLFLPLLHTGTVAPHRVLIVLDESDEDLMLGSEADFSTSLSPLSVTLKQGREFRVGCALGLSHLGETSRFLLSNATYQLFFSPADYKSLWEAAHTLLLPEQGGLQMLRALQAGECVAVEALGPCPYPMLVKIDPVQLASTAVDYQQWPFVPGKRLTDLPELKSALDSLIAEHLRTCARQKQAKRLIPQVAQDLLSLAAMNPNVTWSELCEKMPRPLSAGQRQAAKKALEDARLAKFIAMRYGKTSRLLIELAEEGYAYLNRAVPKRHGRGGVEHRFAVAEVCRAGEAKGYRSAIEHLVSGSNPEHHIDAVWFAPEGIHAFEVAVSCLDNLVSHAKACFLPDSGVASLTIVVSMKTEIPKARSVLESDSAVLPLMDRIRFETLDSITKENDK